MTRDEIITRYTQSLRVSVHEKLPAHARATFAHIIYAVMAPPERAAQGAKLADLPALTAQVAAMVDERDALRARVAELEQR